MGARTQAHARLSDIGLPERYQVLRRIARGGMASVWRAEDLVLGRKVAIKLLSEQFLHDPTAVHRFEREARAAAHLSGHANVVTIFDVGQTEPRVDGETDRPFIVMEYHSGGTVADALRVGEVSRDDALIWLQQAAEALDYAHGRGIVHRDIKPANLLLDGRRVLHVADFGIARLGTEDPITSSGELFGTAAYISPEQAMGRPATAASDRYALAVVAYELLVGERPFKTENLAAQARQHVDEQPPVASQRNRALPPALDAVLARGMAKLPRERWSSASAFAEAARAATETKAARSPAPVAPHRSVAEPPPPPSFITHRSSGGAQRRSRAIALAALAAVLVAVAAAAATGIGGSPTPVRTAHAGAKTPPARSLHHRAKPVAGKPPASTHSSPSTATATTPSSPTPTAPSPTTSTPGGSADAASLQARGHQLMLGGSYNSAVGVLRQAVAAGPSSGLTYAYALYDLGRSLRLAGDPRDAAVVLQRRLQIPNQTEGRAPGTAARPACPRRAGQLLGRCERPTQWIRSGRRRQRPRREQRPWRRQRSGRQRRLSSGGGAPSQTPKPVRPRREISSCLTLRLASTASAA
jgi:serine/threonine protein kinase